MWMDSANGTYVEHAVLSPGLNGLSSSWFDHQGPTGLRGGLVGLS